MNFSARLLLLSSLLFSLTPAQAATRWSAYLADWGTDADTAALNSNLKKVDTLWIRMFEVLPTGHLNLKWVPEGPVGPVLEKISKLKTRPKFGPLLQNTGPNGFSPELGRLILKSVDVWLPELKTLQEKWKFTSLQFDIEELAPGDALDYETAVKKIAAFSQKNKIDFSFALHAQTETPSNNVGAQFQRWSELKQIPGKKILMALDYSWASGTPGAIAPTEWIQKLVAHARLFFKTEDLVVTLPVYGYHWRKGKPGEPALAESLKKIIAQDKNWKRDLTQHESVYRKEDEVISFDSTESVLQKKSVLQKLGLRSFAFWRVGGERAEIYR